MISLILPFAALALIGPAPNPNAAAQPAPATNDPMQITQNLSNSAAPVCYKIRAYIFERNDGAAPRLARETTCPPVHPKLNRAKAKLVPAN